MDTCFIQRIDGYRAAVVDLVPSIHLRGEGALTITRINVPDACTKKGIGSRLLSLVTQEADKYGVVLTLEVASSGWMSNEELFFWYRRHGFEQHGEQHFMIRYPRKTLKGDQHADQQKENRSDQSASAAGD